MHLNTADGPGHSCRATGLLVWQHATTHSNVCAYVRPYTAQADVWLISQAHIPIEKRVSLPWARYHTSGLAGSALRLPAFRR